jgi:hypothetical protein
MITSFKNLTKSQVALFEHIKDVTENLIQPLMETENVTKLILSAAFVRTTPDVFTEQFPEPTEASLRSAVERSVKQKPRSWEQPAGAVQRRTEIITNVTSLVYYRLRPSCHLFSDNHASG